MRGGAGVGGGDTDISHSNGLRFQFLVLIETLGSTSLQMERTENIVSLNVFRMKIVIIILSSGGL